MKKILFILVFMLSSLVMSAQYVTNNYYYNKPYSSVTQNMEPHEYDPVVDQDFTKRIKTNNTVGYVCTGVAVGGLAASCIGLVGMDIDAPDDVFDRNSNMAIVGLCVFTAGSIGALYAFAKARSIRISRNLYFNGGSVTYGF